MPDDKELKASLRDRKDLQAQINEGLRDQNNLTNQYATLLQTQLDSTKDITDDMRDRAGVLNTLVQNNEKSLGLDARINNLKSKSAAIEEKLAKSRTKSGKFQKGFNTQIVKNLELDKKALQTQAAKLETQKLATDALKSAGQEIDKAFGGMGSKITGFLTNPLTAATAILLTFNATQETIAKQFGGIGVTQFRDDLAAANINFTKLGLEGADAQKTISTLANDFGIAFDKADDLSNTVARIAVSTGMSTDETSKLVGLFVKTQGLTGEQAENLLLGARQLAVANNVAPDKVLSDIAADTELFARFSKDGGQNLLRAAVQARKLGIELSSVAKAAGGLLDFQNSLNAEVEASILLGRDVNLQKARQLSLDNDLEGLQAELVKQVGTEAEFNKLNSIQRDKLAGALSMSVSEVQKLVSATAQQKTLQGEINRLSSENEIPEDVITGTAQVIQNFKAIGMELAERIGPTLNFVVKTVGGFVAALAESKLLLPAITTLMGVLLGKSLAVAAANIAAGMGKQLGVGALIGMIAIPAALGLLMGSVGSIASAQEGGITTQEGLVNVHPQEAIVPIEKLGGMIANAMKPVVEENRRMREQNETLINVTRKQTEQFVDAMVLYS
tara:strand:+ start:2078 stop:3928 length:1851 start_codon:yes stop_codon:yes gene_type:complete